MPRASALSVADAAALYARCVQPAKSTRVRGVAVCVDAAKTTGVALAALLHAASESNASAQPPVMAVVSTRNATVARGDRVRNALNEAGVRTVMLECDRDANPQTQSQPPGREPGIRARARGAQSGDDEEMRGFARAAYRHGCDQLALTSTKVDAAVTGLTRLDGAIQPYDTIVPAAEMLPPSVLDVVRPLVLVPPDVLDATTAQFASMIGEDASDASAAEPAETDTPHESEVQRAADQLGVDIDAALRHGNRRHDLMSGIEVASNDLLRSCVIDANHWGYIVVCRNTLARVYHDRASAGDVIVQHAMARLIDHVSGADSRTTFNDELLVRLVDELFAYKNAGRNCVSLSLSTPELVPPPKGRTLAGAIVRPASGPFAKKIQRASLRRRQPSRSTDFLNPASSTRSSERYGQDMIILSREPDHESSRILSRRMGGNLCALPFGAGPGGVYWDNRFVVSAVPAASLSPDQPVVADDVIINTALAKRDVLKDDWERSPFYARQLRHTDWETITSVSKRVRWFNVPYQCVRGLPVVFQKQIGSTAPGTLAAAPHLGLSGRPDMIFTAVRMPRFRCLPADLDPGFSVLGDVLPQRASEAPSEIHRAASS